MPKAGTVLENPISKVRVQFNKTPQETGGLMVEHEIFFPPGKGREYPHVHKEGHETFEVITGTATYQLAGVEKTAKAGETIDFPPGIPHMHPWNAGTDELHVRQTIRFKTPHMRELVGIDTFFETMFGLAKDGKVSKDGMPNMMQIFVSFKDLAPELTMPGIPLPVQSVMMSVFGAVGGMMGIKARYPQYSGE
ncbi:MAG: cupin domain-containing protein [Chloroflexi bacterium]|nr:cupin domain-containing protein [Chloroflexota bacterium]